MMSEIQQLQQRIHKNAVEHGWYDSDVNIPEKLCLIHSEVSEALEDYRKDNMGISYEENGKPVGFDTELADIVIRVLDLAQYMGVDIKKAVEIKHEYNKTRPYKHGNKQC